MPLAITTHGKFRVENLDDPGIPEKGVEILEGDLIVMTPAQKHHNRIAHRLECLFEDHCSRHPDLDYGGDNEGFWVDKDPDTLLSPDACLFKTRAEPEGAWMEFSPEIPVEILSPGNSAAEIAFKVRKYLGCDSEQVWIVDPESESIEFYFKDGRKTIATGDEVVPCEGIAEGLSISLKELLKKG